MDEEQFWGVTLNSTTKECEWNPEVPSKPERPAMKGIVSLILKQAVLGAEAKDGEVNIVEVRAMGPMGRLISVPILYLKGASVHQQLLGITLPEPPAVLKLVSGSGPVHLAGIEKIDFKYNGGELDDEEDDDEELEEEEFDDNLDYKVDSGKRKAGDTMGVGKKRKLDADMDDEDDDLDDDEEDDLAKNKKGVTKLPAASLNKGKAPVAVKSNNAKAKK